MAETLLYNYLNMNMTAPHPMPSLMLASCWIIASYMVDRSVATYGVIFTNHFIIVAPLSELTEDRRDDTLLEPLPTCEGGRGKDERHKSR